MPALINTAAANNVVPQGVSAEMAVQFNGNDTAVKEKRFLSCLLDKICPHHHHEDNCCYEDSCSSDDSCDPCGNDYSNNRCCDDPSSHSGSDCCDSSSSSSSCDDSGSCGFGCSSSDTNCVHKRAMEVKSRIYNGSDLMLDRRQANAANGLHIPKTLLGVAAIAAVGVAAVLN